jgi:hypothetical protein
MNTRPPTCDIALKEWAVIVDALAAGDQLLLLRKGGIADVGGEFRLEAERFLLWPTYLHQEADWLKPTAAGRLAPSLAAQAGPDLLDLTVYAEVAEILPAPSRAALDALEAEHVWSQAYLDQRWRYRPDLPLCLLVLRAWRLARPRRTRERPEQRGCRSWVPVAPALDLGDLLPAVEPAAFEQRRGAIRATLSQYS